MEFKFYLDGIEIEEPTGWKDSELSIKRDMDKYHGLFFSYTTDLEFIGDAYFKLKNLFDVYGFDAKSTITIFLSCNGGEFEEVFKGELNFASYSKKVGNKCSISMEVAESTDEINVVNRQDVDVALNTTESLDGFPIPSITLFDLLMHGYTFFYQGTWQSDSIVSAQITADEIATGIPFYNLLVNPICIAYDEIGGMTNCSNGGASYNLASSSPDRTQLQRDQKIFTASRSSSYAFEFNLNGNFSDYSTQSRGGALNIRFVKITAGGTITILYDITTANVYSVGGMSTYNYPFTASSFFTVNLDDGDVVSLLCFVTNHALTTGSAGVHYDVNFNVTYQSGNYIRVGETNTFPDTTAKAAKIYDAFWKAISYYTGNTDSFYSLYLGYTSAPDRSYIGNGCGSFTALLNGYLIRGFLPNDKPIIVNLSDLFDSVDSIFNIGLGFEVMADGVKRCRIEQKGYFYDNLLLLGYFPDVAKYSESIEESLCYNTIELGFDDYKVEQGTNKLNTNDEFLTKYQWATVATSVKNKFSRICKYISSIYPIETTRRNRYINNGSKESKFDENNFLIALNRDGANSCEKDENFDQISGINSPTEAYNLRFNLFSTLIRWSNIIQSAVTRLYDKKIKYQSGSINTSLELQYNDTCNGAYNDALFQVKQDLPLNDPNNQGNLPIFEPIVYEFDYPMSWRQYNDFKRYPQGMVVFGRSERSLIAAFILEVTYKPTLGMATYKLLRSYKQDLVNLFIIPPDLTLLEMGAIIMYKGLMSNFDTTGLGLGVWSDWAICNGQNGTEDLGGYSIKGYKASDANYNTPYSQHGADSVTLTAAQSGSPEHTHLPAGGTTAFLGTATGTSTQDIPSGSLGTLSVATGGIVGGEQNASQSHENRPRGKAVVFIEKIR